MQGIEVRQPHHHHHTVRANVFWSSSNVASWLSKTGDYSGRYANPARQRCGLRCRYADAARRLPVNPQQQIDSAAGFRRPFGDGIAAWRALASQNALRARLQPLHMLPAAVKPAVRHHQQRRHDRHHRQQDNQRVGTGERAEPVLAGSSTTTRSAMPGACTSGTSS